ncbi:glutathione hydrolase 5 proenzyme isoform 1-T6 [Anomaloglossus baeobatrachus]|uniref:glutathione hydrolase 5 proenzyme n=1 Tax=Anomaloglossus baeobatrachus TaxID=238106 RepID=UPI003F4F5787
MAISKSLFFSLIVVLFLAIVIIIPLVLLLRETHCEEGFTNGAVAADSEICSNIGRDILKQGGSSVDGAIAALLCTSVINPQSMGLGGGVIFTIYDASTRNIEVINARETVPREFLPNLMEQCAEKKLLKTGPQWIGVPGELRGYEAAHKRYGRLPWKSLFQPTIKLVRDGVKVSNVLFKFINITASQIRTSSMCQLLCKDRGVVNAGDSVNFTRLADTLQTLADEGAESFYSGSIGKKMVEDLQHQGSSLTLEDFKNYKVQFVKPLNVSLRGYKLYAPPPPAGGGMLSFILNVLEGYNFDKRAMQNVPDQITTYHRIAEAFKFANGHRDKLTNPELSANLEKFIETFISKPYADKIRNKIDDSGDHDVQFYNLPEVVNAETFGTTHLSVITKDGSSVSVTSSINQVFGSMIYSPSTGIIFNNQLADFCNIHMLSLKEGMHPPSSMTPTILLSEDHRSQLVIGGSGGLRIVGATAQAIMNKLWFGYNMTKAISAPVFNVQLDNSLDFDDSFSPAVQKGLKDRGHTISKSLFRLNVVQGIYQEKGCLVPYSDIRKSGKAAGY